MNEEHVESPQTVEEITMEWDLDGEGEVDTGLAIEVLKQNPTTIEDVYNLKVAAFVSPTAWDRLNHFIRDVMKEDEPDYEVKTAIGLAALGQYEDAESRLEALQNLPVAACLLGRIYQETGREEKAVKVFKKIHERVPEVLMYNVYLAEALETAGDLDGFRRELEQLQGTEPENPNVLYLEGLSLELDGDYEKTKECYRKALKADPNHDRSLFRLAYRLDLEGEDEEAITCYKRCILSGVPNLAALVNLGLLYDDAERYEEASECFNLAEMIYPRNERIRWYRKDAEASLVMYYDEEKEKKEDKQAQILRIPVTDFELSVRSRNCLSKMNIRSLGDLIKKTEAELLAFKNFGETSLQEIKGILNSKGLRLGMMTPDTDEIPAFLETTETEGGEESLYNKPLEELDLSVRSRNCLTFLQIKTLGQLADTSEQQLLACKNFGQTSLNEIRKKLADFGLSLKT